MFAQAIAWALSWKLGHPEVWHPVVSVAVFFITLAYYFGLRAPGSLPAAWGIRASVGVVLATLILVMGRLVALGKWQTAGLVILALLLPFLTRAANRFGARHRRSSYTTRGLVEAAVLGLVTATLILGAGLAASAAPASHVVFYADFLKWAPRPEDAVSRDALLAAATPGDPIPSEAIYQEAVYLTIEELDVHVGGEYRNKSSSPAGQLHVDVLYPHGVSVKSTREPRSGISHDVSEYHFPLVGLRWFAVRTNHYNCFSIDHHSYGWTMRTDADEVDVTFDFSRLGKDSVFDSSFEPRILVIEEPNTTGVVIPIDSTLWRTTSVLQGHIRKAKKNTQIVLDCKWRQL